MAERRDAVVGPAGKRARVEHDEDGAAAASTPPLDYLAAEVGFARIVGDDFIVRATEPAYDKEVLIAPSGAATLRAAAVDSIVRIVAAAVAVMDGKALSHIGGEDDSARFPPARGAARVLLPEDLHVACAIVASPGLARHLHQEAQKAVSSWTQLVDDAAAKAEGKPASAASAVASTWPPSTLPLAAVATLLRALLAPAGIACDRRVVPYLTVVMAYLVLEPFDAGAGSVADEARTVYAATGDEEDDSPIELRFARRHAHASIRNGEEFSAMVRAARNPAVVALGNATAREAQRIAAMQQTGEDSDDDDDDDDDEEVEEEDGEKDGDDDNEDADDGADEAEKKEEAAKKAAFEQEQKQAKLKELQEGVEELLAVAQKARAGLVQGGDASAGAVKLLPELSPAAAAAVLAELAAAHAAEVQFLSHTPAIVADGGAGSASAAASTSPMTGGGGAVASGSQAAASVAEPVLSAPRIDPDVALLFPVPEPLSSDEISARIVPKGPFDDAPDTQAVIEMQEREALGAFGSVPDGAWWQILGDRWPEAFEDATESLKALQRSATISALARAAKKAKGGNEQAVLAAVSALTDATGQTVTVGRAHASFARSLWREFTSAVAEEITGRKKLDEAILQHAWEMKTFLPRVEAAWGASVPKAELRDGGLFGVDIGHHFVRQLVSECRGSATALEWLKLALKLGADVEGDGDCGRMHLMYALGDDAMAHTLLDAGANPVYVLMEKDGIIDWAWGLKELLRLGVCIKQFKNCGAAEGGFVPEAEWKPLVEDGAGHNKIIEHIRDGEWEVTMTWKGADFEN